MAQTNQASAADPSKAGRAAISYSPSRILGALGRRRRDLSRSTRYRGYRKQGLRPAVLFEAFEGKVIGDSPLPIFEELRARGLNLDLIWTVASPATKPPGGSRSVVHGSKEWLRALATSSCIVNNTNNPWYFRKVDGQVYVQCWHGTPLKRLVFDIETGSLTQSYLNVFARDSQQWDYLISPNAYSSKIFRSAFRYDGRILEVGYPRNDILSTHTVADAEAIRSRLGVMPAQKLILYAPTWRDTNRTATGKWGAVNLFAGSVPNGWRMLFRGHTNTHAAHEKHIAGGALDVTAYPNVTELLIAADVLLTDYSSIMFDFSITGKPILFLTPDFEHYTSARGMYFDFESQAPGPLLPESSAVLEALQNLPAVRETYAERYRAWQQKFNVKETGHAARAVVDAVFGN